MTKELIFGHQNPDTDAIAGAISYSYLQNQLGMDTEAVALGQPNDETQFVLDHFHQTAPRVIEKAKPEVDQVMLVDHNEAQQSVSDIKDVTVTHVVDHHRIANFETAGPLYYRAEPLGSSNTVLWKMYHEEGIEIPSQIAGLMMSAIISDTLLLNSPTTTDTDREAIEDLAQLAHEDYHTYGLTMLKAGANIADKSAAALINADAKSFEMGGQQIRIAQVNVVDMDEAVARQKKFEAAMQQSCQENGYALFLLAITNVLDSNTTMIVSGDQSLLPKVEAAFHQKLEAGRMSLPGVVSRKKQIVPPLQQQF
ncbi:manganese-dependent inorganic pyrophosphatase [Bombilactobacillus folatiphilus]|uniref:inorganic diphosphatase n=1 Tax=Bombilactobacillus folatiphilus TaxID=2923362 RepID=A0ABY4P794_9LACO|nr:manganese-dependent inorganic pyrophosphatase [Bombilactobacillus folatiphilus]UQS81487.1 manganese-dependent inorganic pyrophosphatase [Bombilactobacillus folatiphilus]